MQTLLCLWTAGATLQNYVLSYMEARTPAIHHAPDFFLAPLDRVQNDFLEQIGLDATQALLTYNLAPLATRRDISMLGFLHRVSLGLAHRSSISLFGRRRRLPLQEDGPSEVCGITGN